MKKSTKQILVIGSVGILAYFLLLKKTAEALPQEGGSLLQRAQDYLLGDLIGKPSREGSIGSPDLLTRTGQDAQMALNNLMGQEWATRDDIIIGRITQSIPQYAPSTMSSMINYSNGQFSINSNPNYIKPFQSLTQTLAGATGGMSSGAPLSSYLNSPNKLIVFDKPKRYILVNGRQVEVLE